MAGMFLWIKIKGIKDTQRLIMERALEKEVHTHTHTHVQCCAECNNMISCSTLPVSFLNCKHFLLVQVIRVCVCGWVCVSLSPL